MPGKCLGKWLLNRYPSGYSGLVPIDDIAELARVRALVRSGLARAIREKAGVSQSELARSLGVHETTVAKWESGLRLPRSDVGRRYGRILRDLTKVAP